MTDKMADILGREDLDDACLRDSISIASTDSFVSAAEVRGAVCSAAAMIIFLIYYSAAYLYYKSINNSVYKMATTYVDHDLMFKL